MTIFILIVGCKEKQYMRGYYSRETFLKEVNWKDPVASRYEPDPEWADSLKQCDSAEVRIVLGSYCPDSRKWVSRFFNLQNTMPVRLTELVLVDTTKKDERGFCEQNGVKKIPTFFFYRGGKELGRIVEKPRGRLEKRVYQILH